MKKRRNADASLRKLERAAASGEYGDISAYWLALLRTGQLPPPTYDYSTSEKMQTVYGSYSEPWIGWTIPSDRANWPVASRIWQVQIGWGGIAFYVNLWDADLSDSRLSDGQVAENMPEALEQVKVYLKQALTKYDNEKLRNKVLKMRGNPDVDLRKLERLARQGDDNDVLAYYAAAWRAGEIPKGPPVQIVGTNNFLGNSFRAPANFWIFANGWGLSGYWDMGQRYLPFKLSTKNNSSMYVDSTVGRWVDVDWRDLAKVERDNTSWDLSENRASREKLAPHEMITYMANLRSKPSQVVGFADRLGGA